MMRPQRYSDIARPQDSEEIPSSEVFCKTEEEDATVLTSKYQRILFGAQEGRPQLVLFQGSFKQDQWKGRKRCGTVEDPPAFPRMTSHQRDWHPDQEQEQLCLLVPAYFTVSKHSSQQGRLDIR